LANTEGLFHNIQSIPSPKVKPFKRWLALLDANSNSAFDSTAKVVIK
jgi:hypothetical protein